MLKNYLKIAWRNLRKHRGYTFINVAGLAVGAASCLLIGLYIRDELSYDRYHERTDRLYRLVTVERAKTPPALASGLLDSYPYLIEEAVRVWPLFAPAKVQWNDVVFVEDGGVFADSSVFSVFSWRLVEGRPEEVLAAPNSIVLTQSMVQKYFGTEDPLGATLRFWGRDLTVTGVMQDVPLNSHIRFDFLVSFPTLHSVMGSGLDEEWGMPAFYTYVLAREGAAAPEIEAAAQRLFASRRVRSESPLVLQPIHRIHLHSHLEGEAGTNGNLAYLYVLATAAVLVLLLACVNFTNLTTVRAATRIREVGIRKALGAEPGQIMSQFFGETALVAVTAVLVALMLAELVLPAFNQISGKALDLRYVGDPILLIALILLTLVIGLAAGSYPALVLSRFRPVGVLKGDRWLRSSGLPLRKVLVVLQFTVSTALSIGVGVVFFQLDYLQSKDLGFEKERVLVLDGDRFPLVRDALENVPGVEHVAGAPRAIGGALPRGAYRVEGSPTDSTKQMLHLGATPGYHETMRMRLVAGRSFAAGSLGDETAEFVLNESAVRALGWNGGAEAVGKVFGMFVPPTDGGEEVWRDGRIVGVVEDFHHDALYRGIEPVALYPSTDLNLTFVRVRQVSPEILKTIESVWAGVNPDAPFNYYFLDEHLSAQYRADQRLGSILGAATGLALLIACLGLLGLAAFNARQRTKEIGVRKVLGASVSQIVALMSADFMKPVGIAAVLAVPIAYVAVDRWLQSFAYRIELSWAVFAAGCLAAISIALLTVTFQVVRAARADAVESLRYE